MIYALLLFLTIIFPQFSFAEYSLPAANVVTWQGNVGIPGGIPTRSTICGTANATVYGDGVTEAHDYLQGLIDACGKDQVVYIPTGTYKVTGQLLVNARPIVIRGDGPTKSIIKFYGTSVIRGRLAFWFYAFSARALTVYDWTAGYTKGATQITLSSVANMEIGQEILIDQLNDTTIVNPIGMEVGLQACARAGADLGVSDSTRCQSQWNRVSDIDVPNKIITLEVPLYKTWDSGLTPQVSFWYAIGNESKPGNPKYAGVEDLCLDGSTLNISGSKNGDALLAATMVSYFWMKNVEITSVPSRGFWGTWLFRPEIRDSYIRDAQGTGSTNYGIQFDYVSGGLIENNIFKSLVASIVLGYPNSGNVIGYNYALFGSPGDTWSYPDFASHDSHNYANLFEGNDLVLLSFDYIHGSGSHQVAFRNRIHGWQTGKTGQTIAFAAQAWNRYSSVVGNILGTSGYHTVYGQEVPTYYPGGFQNAIYTLGYCNTPVYETCVYGDTTTYSDADTVTTLLRHANYDYVNNGVVWNGSDDHVLPSSLYLASKPSWYGYCTWPPVDPSTVRSSTIPAKGKYNGNPSCYPSLTVGSGSQTITVGGPNTIIFGP